MGGGEVNLKFIARVVVVVVVVLVLAQLFRCG